jgi:polyhydroxybutyrate depolymerase
MKDKTNTIILIYMLLISSVSLQAQYDSIVHDNYDRTFLLHLPTGYTGTTHLPLIVALHGGFGNAYNIESQSQLSIKADLENFIVVYPEGIAGGILGITSWNAGWCCGYSSNNNIDDVGFINKLLDTLIDQYLIDTNRIYVTGMSNGGFLSYRLACELSHRIAAIAPVAASMSIVNCNPQRPVPIISFHSYLDTQVPYIGGIGDGPSSHYNSPQDSILNIWSDKNYCLSSNDTIINNPEYTNVKWTNCDCETEIHQYITQDGGHSWPGGIQTAIGDPVSNFINASDLMWNFFQQHTLDCEIVSVEKQNIQERPTIQIFPNPTNSKINIQSSVNWSSIKVSIFNTQGQEILCVMGQTEIDISNLTDGLLFIKIEMDNIIRTDKLLKTD